MRLLIHTRFVHAYMPDSSWAAGTVVKNNVKTQENCLEGDINYI